MKTFWFTSDAKGLSDKPGKNWILVLFKNSFKKRQLKFSIVAPSLCSADDVELKTSSPGTESDLYDVTPTNPLMHPVKEDEVFPV